MTTHQSDSEGLRMSSFMRNHGEVLFSVLTATVLFAYSYGQSQVQIENLRQTMVEGLQQRSQEMQSLTQRINVVEKEGTGLSHANKWVLEQHGKEIIEVKSDGRKISESLSEMRTDLRLIAAWVRQQEGGREVIGEARRKDDDIPE